MTWVTVIQLSVTILIAVSSWFIGHYFASRREAIRKHRDIRLEYLIKTYRAMNQVRASVHLHWNADMATQIVSDVQLFGTPDQADQMKQWVKQIVDGNGASLDELISSIRDELRRELNLAPVEGKVTWFRTASAEELKEMGLIDERGNTVMADADGRPLHTKW